MKADLNIYGDGATQHKAAFSLIIFSAETLKRANLIKGLDKLRTYTQMMKLGLQYNQMELVHEFIFEYVIDCVRISMFFEAYMKAELIVANCCIHNINKDGANSALKKLADDQRKKPINLNDIEAAEPFIVDSITRDITHKYLKATTLSFSTLNAPNYRQHYQFDNFIADAIKEFNDERNILHFKTEAGFQLSELLVNRLERINAFVDATIEKWKQKFQK